MYPILKTTALYTTLAVTCRNMHTGLKSKPSCWIIFIKSYYRKDLPMRPDFFRYCCTGMKYSMHDVICDVISWCAFGCDGCWSDRIVIENRRNFQRVAVCWCVQFSRMWNCRAASRRWRSTKVSLWCFAAAILSAYHVPVSRGTRSTRRHVIAGQLSTRFRSLVTTEWPLTTEVGPICVSKFECTQHILYLLLSVSI